MNIYSWDCWGPLVIGFFFLKAPLQISECRQPCDLFPSHSNWLSYSSWWLVHRVWNVDYGTLLAISVVSHNCIRDSGCTFILNILSLSPSLFASSGFLRSACFFFPSLGIFFLYFFFFRPRSWWSKKSSFPSSYSSSSSPFSFYSSFFPCSTSSSSSSSFSSTANAQVNNSTPRGRKGPAASA